MKKFTVLIMVLLLTVSLVAFVGCGSQTKDPGPPPGNIINPGNSEDSSSNNSTDTTTPNENGDNTNDSDVLENAVSVRIGRDGRKNWSVNMYSNAASLTMLDYLSGSSLLFPTYTYREEEGFVAQSIRGSYTRNDEVKITDIKAGELYLFSGGQLRFYFKDVKGANITATPVGYFADTDGLTEAVIYAYESNLGDYWGVDVYFQITRNY